MSEPVLEVRGLVKRFGRHGLHGRPIPAVDGLSLSVGRGEALGLVGESGCGKTTTARLALRLLEPDAGTVHFEGADVTRLAGRRLRPLRRRAQVVFQDPESALNPRRTAGAIVAEPLAIHGLHGRGAQRRRVVLELMERVGLAREHHDRFPHQFSGGERQRIAIARAIALEPSLLVADEPVSALDASVQAQILNLLNDLRRDSGLALVLISHDLAVVRHVCDRVAVMEAGRLVEVAPAADLYAHPRHAQTRALLDAARTLRGRPAQPAAGSSSSGS